MILETGIKTKLSPNADFIKFNIYIEVLISEKTKNAKTVQRIDNPTIILFSNCDSFDFCAIFCSSNYKVSSLNFLSGWYFLLKLEFISLPMFFSANITLLYIIHGFIIFLNSFLNASLDLVSIDSVALYDLPISKDIWSTLLFSMYFAASKYL